MRSIFLFSQLFMYGMFLMVCAFAEGETPGEPVPAVQPDLRVQQVRLPEKKLKLLQNFRYTRKKGRASKGGNSSEKDYEGTEAPNRFEARSVPKSQYQNNGESLEVDPD